MNKDLTWVEVNLTAIKNNIGQLKRFVDPKALFSVVIKANAYGHGLVQVAEAALAAGAQRFCVISVNEVARLREAGIKVPIMLLGAVAKNDLQRAIRFDAIFTVYNKESAEALSFYAGVTGKEVKVHLKIDTGMSRLGVKPEVALEFAKWLTTQKGIKLEGVFTHFSCADCDPDYTNQQFQSFLKVTRELEQAGFRLLRHCANSATTMQYREMHLDMVRCGIATYGLYPSNETRSKSNIKLEPAMSFKTQVVSVKYFAKGTKVGYAALRTLPTDGHVAVLPVGYAEGFPRILTNKADVLIRGSRQSTVGRICMNQCMAFVSNDVKIGDEVVLFGRQGKAEISVEEQAEKAQSSQYEIPTRIPENIPRVYVD